jgi:hypothetical protein
MSTCRGRRQLLLILGIVTCVLAGWGIVWVGSSTPEPTLEGRPVRELLRRAADQSYSEYHPDLATVEKYHAEVLEAFRRNGSNAVPGLVQLMLPVHASLVSRAAVDLNRRGSVDLYWGRAGVYQHLPAIVHDWVDRTAIEAERRRADREWAILLVASLGATAAAAHPALISACHDRDRYVRAGAAKALVRTHVPPDIAIPILCEMMLRDSDSEVRFAVALSLGEMHGSGAPAIPALSQAAADTDRGVTAAARVSLRQIVGVREGGGLR